MPQVIRHKYTENWSFEGLMLSFAEVSTVWVIPFPPIPAGGLHRYRRPVLNLPLMAFDLEIESDAVQEYLDAISEMNDGQVDVHLVEIQKPEEKIYGFFAVERGVFPKISLKREETPGVSIDEIVGG